MRLTYLDEAGTSRNEPFAVVAGVIVHGDAQLPVVEDYLKKLTTKYIPETDHPRFAFHATELWSGTKYFRDRERWPVQTRFEILSLLAEIPHKFDLPIVHGYCEKSEAAQNLKGQPLQVQDFVHHAAAFANATQLTERYFRKRHPNEYTVIIAEDRPDIRRLIKLAQASLQGRAAENQLPPDVIERFEELPYRHIRDTVHFAGKSESSLLQIADVCAFFVRGALIKNLKIGHFTDLLSLATVSSAAL